jgi:hypothetical protein
MPPLTPEEAKLLDEIFENLDPETIEILSKIGEEYIQEELKAGRDPFAIFNQPEMPAGQPPQPAKPVQPVAPVQPATPAIIIDVKTMEQLRDTLQLLRDKITSVRQRAEATRRTQELIAPWKYHLDDLIYYSHLLAQDKLLKYLSDKDFERLVLTIKTLTHELSSLEPLFQMREITIEEENPFDVLGISPRATPAEIHAAYQKVLDTTAPEALKKQYADKSETERSQALKKAADQRTAATESYTAIMAQEQSIQALETILETIGKAIYTNDLFNDIKKLLKRYEPEALKIKEEQEKKEASARKEQEELIRRRPTITPIRFEPSYDISRTGTPSKAPEYRPSIETGAPSVTAGKEGITPTKLGEKEQKAPEKKGEERKKEKGKEKEKEKKGKEEKGEKGGKLPPAYKKLEDKVIAIEKLFKDLAKEIEKKPLLPTDKSLPDVFKDFATYLKEPIAKPYNADDPVFVRAQQINDGLKKLTENFRKITTELETTLKDLSPNEKPIIKKSVRKILDDYKKSHLNNKEYLKDLMEVSSKIELKDIPVEKKFIHFGINEFPDINDPANAPIKKLNKADEEGKFINYVGLFFDEYKKLRDLLKEKK